jgi:hypothetical protein
MSDSVSISVDHRAIAPLPCQMWCKGFDSETLELDFEIDQSGGLCGASRDDSVKFPESFGIVPGSGNDDQRDKVDKRARYGPF